MAVEWTVLGSGSRGNCVVLTTSRTQVLIDAGFSCRETLRRMVLAGLDPRRTSAILISHEHSDHVAGVPVLARRLKVPVFMSAATHTAWKRGLNGAAGLPRLEFFQAGRGLNIGDIDVSPFTVPHDAADPVGFTFQVAGLKLGIATDLGYLPNNVIDELRGCDLLMIESNHDVEMLRTGPYPWAVKQRVLSRVGHLSNESLGEFFAKDYDGAARHVILAHLSEQNNHPEIARRVAEGALNGRSSPNANRLVLASQTKCLESIRM